MEKPIIGILSAAAIIAAANAASAMPITPPAASTSSVEQVHWVCNPWGRCWWRPDYYRPYGYYRYRHDDGDDWRRGYRYRYGYHERPHYWGGYGGWRRDREDDED